MRKRVGLQGEIVNNNIKPTYEKLKSLSENLKMKAEWEIFISWTGEEYLNDVLPKPEKKRLLPTVFPTMQNIFKNVAYFGGFVAAFVLFLVLCGNAIANDADSMWIGFTGLLVLISAIGSFVRLTGIFAAVKKRGKDIKEYHTNVEKNKDIKKYNENEYPQEVKRYQEKAKEILSEFNTVQQQAKENLPLVEEEIARLRDVISERYDKDIDTILEIIEDGRADDLKEAINVLLEERRAAEIRAEQREFQERLAREQAQAAHEAALMERQAIREMQVEQKRAAEQERWRANRETARAFRACRNCAHFTKCRRRGTVNCATYQPE